jgi:hypothetical protein
MTKLHSATEIEREPDADAIECSWSRVVRGIERYAAYQPAGAAEDLRQWADLLEGIRQLRDD